MSRKKKNNAVRQPVVTAEGHRQKMHSARGKVQMSREEYAFVILQDSEGNFVKNDSTDVFVPAARTIGALHGDIVVVKYISVRLRNTCRREGRIVEIVSRSLKPFVGVLHIVGRQCWVLMESKNMPYDISVPFDEKLREYVGYKVSVVIDGWDNWDPAPRGHVMDILGPSGSNETEMHAILSEFDLPYRFSPDIDAEAEKIDGRITSEIISSRRDFRSTFTFTIDPAEAKDFDDALSFQAFDDGTFEIGVHIADVSHYVLPGSLIDREALERGTSVYLVDRTVPMLPERLCNELCSLRPDEDKLCFSAVFKITGEGQVLDTSLCKTVIRSNHRLNYEQAQAILDDASRQDLSAGQVAELRRPLKTLYRIAMQLKEARFKAGAISFERPEMKVRVDAEGKPVEVYQKMPMPANFLIEEFMLLANRSVAETVSRMGKTMVYRIHDVPQKEKVEALGHFAKTFGLKMGPVDSNRHIALSLNSLLKAAKGTAAASAIEMLSLRSMARAVYSVDNIGHYGLAFKDYTHFTSPIRRYPDLMVHRLLEMYLAGAQSQNRDTYRHLCQHCSQRESLATEAERASIKYKLIEFMQDKVGKEFEGTVSGLTQWGMYVEIEPSKIEGMIALRDMSLDYYEFDEKNFRIIGRHTRRKYTLGSKVRIVVKKASLQQKILDFILVEEPVKKCSRSRKKDK